MRTARTALNYALAEVTYPIVWLNGRPYTQCLRAVTDWYQFLGSGYRNANDMWAASTQKHSPAETPPLGAPGFWGGGSNGDTRLYAGNGLWRGTNLSTKDLRCVTLTTAQVTAQSGNAYYGWVSAFGSTPIDFSAPASTTTTPFPPEPSIEKDSTMYLIKHPNGQQALTDGVSVFLQIAGATMTELVPIYGPPVSVSEAAWQFTADRVAERVAFLNSLKAPTTVTGGPSKEDIAAEVIRQLKLPGN